MFPCTQWVAQFANDLIEVPEISRASFDPLIPFNVVEQSSRSCLCVYCFKAILLTIALYDLWPILHQGILHQGATPGSACTCDCDLCKNSGCVDYLPYNSRKAVYSMGKFSDKHVCAKEFLYTSEDGTRVESYKLACVAGTCPKCKRMQDVFFKCPRHKGGPQSPALPHLHHLKRLVGRLSRTPTTGGGFVEHVYRGGQQRPGDDDGTEN